MDLLLHVSQFVDDLLAVRGDDALTAPVVTSTAGEAAAAIRFNLAVHNALIADGWTPPEGAKPQARRDADLLLEADDDWHDRHIAEAIDLWRRFAVPDETPVPADVMG